MPSPQQRVVDAVCRVALSTKTGLPKQVMCAVAASAWRIRADVLEQNGNKFDADLFRGIADALGEMPVVPVDGIEKPR